MTASKQLPPINSTFKCHRTGIHSRFSIWISWGIADYSFSLWSSVSVDYLRKKRTEEQALSSLIIIKVWPWLNHLPDLIEICALSASVSLCFVSSIGLFVCSAWIICFSSQDTYIIVPNLVHYAFLSSSFMFLIF